MLKSKNYGLVAPARYIVEKQKPKAYQNSGKSKKIERNVMIKPSSGYDRQIDYRFQTEEEIETEQECKKIQNKCSFQKRNNSFSSSGPDSMVPQVKKQRKRLEFYCCDSLAIRPSGNSAYQTVLKNKESPALSPVKKGQTTLFATENQGDKLQKSLEFRSLKPKPRRKNKIFEERFLMLKQRSNDQLPFALQPYEPSQHGLSQKERERLENEFHIIIETDQITQCCL